MSSTTAAPRVSPELRAAVYHFAVFGSTGVASVYFGIWLINRGISAEEIGIINAAPLLAMLLVNQLVGRIADRMPDWRGVIIVLSLISGLVPIGLFFVAGFWGILGVWIFSVMPAVALVPVIDAATLRMTQRRGTDFSAVRAWGTVGFMLSTLCSGPLIAWLGDGAFVPVFVATALLRAVLAFQLPQFRSGEDRTASRKGASRLREVLKPWFLMGLLGLAILYSTHGVIGAFAAVLWTEQGIPQGLIGPLTATMAAAEAAMMFVWSRLKLKVSARHIIIFACLVAAFRWTAMAFSPPIWALFALQLLHSITFAMGYLGGIYFIANWTSDDIAAETQGFFQMLMQGMSVIALLAFGWLTGLMGAKAYLVAAAFAGAGGVLIWVSLAMQSPKQPGEPALG